MSLAAGLPLAYCGLDCNHCDEYRATRSGDLAALEAARLRWGHLSLQDTLCDGCRGGGRITGSCGRCPVRACAGERGLATCADCPDYACPKLQPVLAHTPLARQTLERLRGG
ncbi:MAG: DUF3795 domain-containing protein [Anaerolineae bacterium]